MPHPTPHAVITFNEQTGRFGFRVYFPGRRPHYSMDTCRTAELAKACIGPLDERVWEETPNDAGDVIAISRTYKPGSVAQRMTRYERALARDPGYLYVPILRGRTTAGYPHRNKPE